MSSERPAEASATRPSSVPSPRIFASGTSATMFLRRRDVWRHGQGASAQETDTTERTHARTLVCRSPLKPRICGVASQLPAMSSPIMVAQLRRRLHYHPLQSKICPVPHWCAPTRIEGRLRKQCQAQMYHAIRRKHGVRPPSCHGRDACDGACCCESGFRKRVWALKAVVQVVHLSQRSTAEANQESE